MIDTDKYEGHTEGPWTATQVKSSEHPDEYIIESGDGLLMTGLAGLGNDGANAQLIADAPLLLEEIKRYRQVFDRAIECALNDNAEQAIQFLLNMDYCLDDEEKVTDENKRNYRWFNGEWRARK